MPSGAFKSFEYNLVDVARLIESHRTLSGGGQGRRGLGHLTRSAVVMACAAWELYLEQLLQECAAYFVSQISAPTDLPLTVQKEISKHVRDHKHELRPLALSGDGWKTVYNEHVSACTGALNTPKSTKIDDLFIRLLGIPQLSSSWAIGSSKVDDFVRVRGDIAHRGRHADYVTVAKIQTYVAEIRSAACDTDNSVAEHAKATTGRRYKPWNVTS